MIELGLIGNNSSEQIRKEQDALEENWDFVTQPICD
jgi:hypothetical protein